MNKPLFNEKVDSALLKALSKLMRFNLWLIGSISKGVSFRYGK